MSPEELARREERAEREDWIISETDDGYRIYSPGSRSRPYLVTGLPDEPTCNCPDFEYHASDPGWRCKHILAVQNQTAGSSPVSESERPSRATEESEPAAQPDGSRVLIKRSVSPDGKIDALSVEVSAPVDGNGPVEVESRAGQMLTLGDRIVARFLERNGPAKRDRRRKSRPKAHRPARDGSIPAELVSIRGTDGKWGRRLYMTVRTNDGYLRLYGSRRQLADHLIDAGVPDLADEIEEDVSLRVPCRVMTETNEDGYVRVTRVLPPDRDAHRRAVAR